MKLLLITLLFQISIGMSLHAATRAKPWVEVGGIKFKKASADWLQMEIAIKITGNVPKSKLTNNHLSNIGVQATLAYESGKKLVFFKSELTIAALKTGKEGKVYFFMPGDVVEMYKLNKNPKYAYVSLSVDGQQQPPTQKSLFGDLKANKLKPFLNKASSSASKNEGVFLSITDAPWYVQNGIDIKKLPSFIKKK